MCGLGCAVALKYDVLTEHTWQGVPIIAYAGAGFGGLSDAAFNTQARACARRKKKKGGGVSELHWANVRVQWLLLLLWAVVVVVVVCCCGLLLLWVVFIAAVVNTLTHADNH